MAQQDLLLPWLGALDNVLLGYRLRGVSRAELKRLRERGRELLDRVGLGGREGDLPATLSGGMRQRVALARTLMEDRPVVLMDEPFSALDAITRFRLQDLAAEMLAGRTVLLVTHSPSEAVRLGHRLYVLSGQPARPRRPARAPRRSAPRPGRPGGAVARGRAAARAHPLPAAGRGVVRALRAVVTALGLLLAWEALVRLTRVPPFILPAPEAGPRGARHLPRPAAPAGRHDRRRDPARRRDRRPRRGTERAPARLLRGRAPLAAAAPRRQPGAARVRARPAARPLDGLRHGVEGRDGGARHLLSRHLRLLRRPEARRARLARAGAGDERPPRRHALAHPRPRRPAGDGLGPPGRGRRRTHRGRDRRVGRLERRPRLPHAPRQRPDAGRSDVRRPPDPGRDGAGALRRRRRSDAGGWSAGNPSASRGEEHLARHPPRLRPPRRPPALAGAAGPGGRQVPGRARLVRQPGPRAARDRAREGLLPRRRPRRRPDRPGRPERPAEARGRRSRPRSPSPTSPSSTSRSTRACRWSASARSSRRR